MKILVKLIIFGVILYSILSIATACSEEADCSLAARPMMNCNLFTIDPETQRVDKDTLDSLTITSPEADSIILNNMKEVKKLSLPLRYTEDSTVMIFHYSKTLRDTVIIHQVNTPYFLSMDCGYQMKQSIEAVSYTRHYLDSIHISNPEAGIYERENLMLFY